MTNSEESCISHLQAAILSIDGSVRFSLDSGLSLLTLLLHSVPAQHVSICSCQSQKPCRCSVELTCAPNAHDHSSLMQESQNKCTWPSKQSKSQFIGVADSLQNPSSTLSCISFSYVSLACLISCIAISSMSWVTLHAHLQCCTAVALRKYCLMLPCQVNRFAVSGLHYKSELQLGHLFLLKHHSMSIFINRVRPTQWSQAVLQADWRHL